MKDLRELLRDRIGRDSSKFTRSDQRIAEYLLRSYPQGMLENASQISQKVHLDVSTVTRFFPKIGYQSIRDFHRAFRENIGFVMNSPLDRYRQRDREKAFEDIPFPRVMELDLANLRNTFENMKEKDIRSFLDLIVNKSKKVYVLGERKTFALAFYLYIQLHALRPDVILLRTDMSLIADLLAEIQSEDTLLVFDFRRYPVIHRRAAEAFKSVGAKVVVFTDSPLAPTAKLATLLFLVETRGVSIFDSYTAGFALINGLISEITKQSRGLVKERYERLEKSYSQFEIFLWQTPGLGMRFKEQIR
jgi:DNA-binding MurR/RpiR family transcriptional regulator